MTNGRAEDWKLGGFGLYVHWPFCAAKCPYCDFNSHVVAQVDQRKWAAAFVQEIARVKSELPDRVLNSVFFGGGTPSLMLPETVATILDAVRSAWPTSNDLEITLEANPTSVEAQRFKGYRDAGVNRISMGIQALNDADLRKLGRMHSVAEAEAALDVARSCFDRVSFDLIYARQDQSPDQWQTELAKALSWSPDHLSLYQLTIEDGTAFGDRYSRGKLRGLPNEDHAAEMYEITQYLCDNNGLPRYEVSNHARDGAESRHNLIYWRYGDYVGIGPGAHGRITVDGTRYATECARAPGEWMAKVATGSGEIPRSTLTFEDQAGEYLMMGLRVREGIDVDRYANLAGEQLNAQKIENLRSLGLVRLRGRNLIATNRGSALLNGVLAELI
jgi:oxygen-independent coproporphyrinogen-3 oxidase